MFSPEKKTGVADYRMEPDSEYYIKVKRVLLLRERLSWPRFQTKSLPGPRAIGHFESRV